MALLDDLRRGISMPGRDDQAAARRSLREMSLDTSPEARFAIDVARAVVPEGCGIRELPDGLVRIMLPELARDPRPLPRDPDIRRITIARAALDAVRHHVEHGDDRALGPELGRAIRQASIRNTHSSSVTARPMAAVLEQRDAQRALAVKAFLSVGAPVEELLDAQADRLVKPGGSDHVIPRLKAVEQFRDPMPSLQSDRPRLVAWVRAGLAAERGAARAGVTDPRRIVELATERTSDGEIARMHGLPRVHPDFAAARSMAPSERSAEVARFTTSKADPEPRGPWAGRPAPTETRVERGVSMGVAATMAMRGSSIA